MLHSFGRRPPMPLEEDLECPTCGWVIVGVFVGCGVDSMPAMSASATSVPPCPFCHSAAHGATPGRRSGRRAAPEAVVGRRPRRPKRRALRERRGAPASPDRGSVSTTSSSSVSLFVSPSSARARTFTSKGPRVAQNGGPCTHDESGRTRSTSGMQPEWTDKRRGRGHVCRRRGQRDGAIAGAGHTSLGGLHAFSTCVLSGVDGWIPFLALLM